MSGPGRKPTGRAGSAPPSRVATRSPSTTSRRPTARPPIKRDRRTVAPLTSGSLCTGYGGLDMALAAVLPHEMRWYAEHEPPTKSRPRPRQAAAKVFAHRHPGLPNLGDIRALDWTTVEPVDVLTAGWPCQDVSTAGLQRGLRRGTRSGLWHDIAAGIAILRPGLVVLENVRGVLSAPADGDMEPCPGCLGERDRRGRRPPALRALGAALGSLADLGYDAVWYGLHAADVGAPHHRFRVFIAAADPRNPGRWVQALDAAAAAPVRNQPLPLDGSGHPPRPGPGGPPAADPESGGRTLWQPEPAGQQRRGEFVVGRLPPAAHPDDQGQKNQSESCRAIGPEPGAGPGAGHRHPAQGVHALDGRSDGVDFGDYTAAIRRWERVLGRPAPDPTIPGHRGAQVLSPRFVEWMMGVSPPGWVTDVPDLSRADLLQILGNGVVQQQGAAALAHLLPALRNLLR